MGTETKNVVKYTMYISSIVIIFAIFIFILAISTKVYEVWAKEMVGKALLAESSHTRMIQIEQAKGELEASKLRAQAIKIMGEAAKKYPEYRNQEFMAAFGEALREGNMAQIIYVPTEANIPIMEANRFNLMNQNQ